MDDHPDRENASIWGGYLSYPLMLQFKRKVTLLALLFCVALIGLPAVLTAPMGPALPTGNSAQAAAAQLTKSAFWRGRIWYVGRSSKDDGYALKALALEPDAVATTATEGALPDAWILPDRDSLWLVSSAGTRRYRNGVIQPVSAAPVAVQSRPFLYRGRPALVHGSTADVMLSVLETNIWMPQRTIKPPFHYYGPKNNMDLKALVINDRIVLFLRHLLNVEFCELPPEKTVEIRRESWVSVGSGLHIQPPWCVLADAEGPAIFYSKSADRSGILGVRWTRDGWKTFIDLDTPRFKRMTVLALDRFHRFVAVVQTYAGAQYRLIEFNEMGIIESIDYEERVAIPLTGLLWLFLPFLPVLLLPPALAVILSRMMPDYRVTVHTGDTFSMQYASLSRRAGAQCVDLLVIGAPFFAVSISTLQSVFGGAGLQALSASPAGFGPNVAMVLWLLLCFIGYSFFEGRWGGGPGKWIMNIRVLGSDLQPCGLKRAMLRNLLKLLDGLFAFMVAILMAAISERWQRIGDIAAGTVVVRAGHIEALQFGKDHAFY